MEEVLLMHRNSAWSIKTLFYLGFCVVELVNYVAFTRGSLRYSTMYKKLQNTKYERASQMDPSIHQGKEG
jgi:hypothetical protein